MDAELRRKGNFHLLQLVLSCRARLGRRQDRIATANRAEKMEQLEAEATQYAGRQVRMTDVFTFRPWFHPNYVPHSKQAVLMRHAARHPVRVPLTEPSPSQTCVRLQETRD